MKYKLFYEREFDAAHQLTLGYNSKCKRLHGHRWKVQFEIETNKLNDEGMVIDYTELKDMVDFLDHKYLNELTDGLTEEQTELMEQPTAEHIAQYFYDVLCTRLKWTQGPYAINTVRVSIWEGPNSMIQVSE